MTCCPECEEVCEEKDAYADSDTTDPLYYFIECPNCGWEFSHEIYLEQKYV